MAEWEGGKEKEAQGWATRHLQHTKDSSQAPAQVPRVLGLERACAGSWEHSSWSCGGYKVNQPQLLPPLHGQTFLPTGRNGCAHIGCLYSLLLALTCLGTKGLSSPSFSGGKYVMLLNIPWNTKQIYCNVAQ